MVILFWFIEIYKGNSCIDQVTVVVTADWDYRIRILELESDPNIIGGET